MSPLWACSYARLWPERRNTWSACARACEQFSNDSTASSSTAAGHLLTRVTTRPMVQHCRRVCSAGAKHWAHAKRQPQGLVHGRTGQACVVDRGRFQAHTVDVGTSFIQNKWHCICCVPTAQTAAKLQQSGSCHGFAASSWAAPASCLYSHCRGGILGVKSGAPSGWASSTIAASSAAASASASASNSSAAAASSALTGPSPAMQTLTSQSGSLLAGLTSKCHGLGCVPVLSALHDAWRDPRRVRHSNADTAQHPNVGSRALQALAGLQKVPPRDRCQHKALHYRSFPRTSQVQACFLDLSAGLASDAKLGKPNELRCGRTAFEGI